MSENPSQLTVAQVKELASQREPLIFIDSRTPRPICREDSKLGYPYSFLVPIAQNEPWLGSALRRVAGLVEDFDEQGIPAERVVVMGFLQGACLSLEFAARHARRYAAVVAFTGGLIGPPDTPRDYAGDFAGTPVFIGAT